jgi:hypothetical protein
MIKLGTDEGENVRTDFKAVRHNNDIASKFLRADGFAGVLENSLKLRGWPPRPN